MTEPQKQQAIAGVALIVLGLGLYYLENVGHALVFFLVGGIFLALYYFRREFGYLIPGCTILSLGIGSVANSLFPAFRNGLALGLGFMTVTVVALIREKRFVWWPLIPGGLLVVFNLPRGRELVSVVLERWQLGLVLVGIIILIGAFIRPGSRLSKDPEG